MTTQYVRLVSLAMLALLMWLTSACSPSTSHAQSPGAGGPPPVSVAPVTRRMVEEFEEFSARLAAVDQVDVRARVAGTLERVHFRDGQAVQKGALLFSIDPRPFAAEVASSTAALASALTQAALARSELDQDGNEQAFTYARYGSYLCTRTQLGHSELGALKDLSVASCNQYCRKLEDRLVKGYVGMLEIEDTLHETATKEALNN